jgi:hypothetical protein
MSTLSELVLLEKLVSLRAAGPDDRCISDGADVWPAWKFGHKWDGDPVKIDRMQLEKALKEGAWDVLWLNDQELDDALKPLFAFDLFWAVRPSFNFPRRLLIRSVVERERAVSRLVTARQNGSFTIQGLRTRLRRRVSPPSPRPFSFWATNDSGVLRVWSTENQRLALVGVDRQSIETAEFEVHRAPPSALQSDVVEAVTAVCGALGVSPAPILRALAEAQALREKVVTIIEHERPRTVVDASTANYLSRILVLEARRRHVPTVYVPHAPTSLTRTYADIPQDNALLRGQADVDYYAALGADTTGLQVTGDQMFVRGERVHEGRPIILVSASADLTVYRLVTCLRRIRRSRAPLLADVVVAAHPRGRSRAEEAAEEFDIEVADGRTSEVMRRRNVLGLISEAPSGVLLEAEAMGIPTLLFSDRTNYLYELMLGVPSVDTVRGINEWLSGLETGSVQWEARVARTEPFVAADGGHATARIETALAGPLRANSPVLDTWRWKGSGD